MAAALSRSTRIAGFWSAGHRMKAEFEHAAAGGDVATLEAQLKSGADVNARDHYGQTALMLAAHRGHLDLVQVLLRHGANLDATAKHGLSALMLAIVGGHEAVARALAQAGADRALRGSGAPGFAGKTARDLAREHGMTALAEELAP